MVQKKQKSAVAYALLALFLGCFGVHKFYAGKPGLGLLMLGWLPMYIISAVCMGISFDVAGVLYAVATFWLVGVSIWAFVDMIIGFCNVKTPQKLFK